MSNKTKEYAFKTRLDIPYEKAVEQVTAVLKEQGFGVLTTVDMQAALKEKLGKDFRRYTILGACNPPLAYQALNTQLDIGLLLPCNVIVYEEDGGSQVKILNPIKMMDVADNSELDPVAYEAQERLQKVIEALQKP